MTAAPATPQVIRDRLLQATDGQSNICNMVVVLEAVSFLERYPITKEALEETRLGKLINDIRKKTKNEDLARRAKKLLRNWQKLIEPGKGEVLSKEHTGASWSSNGGVHPSIATPLLGKTGQELKNRNDFNNCLSPRKDKARNRKSKGEPKEGQFKTSPTDKFKDSRQLTIIGIDSRSEMHTDSYARLPLEQETSESFYNDKPSSIPVNAVKPHPSALGYSGALSTSPIKAAVLQQQARREQAATGGQCRPRSPRCTLHSPQHPKQKGVVKQTTQAHREMRLPSPALRTKSLDTFGQGPTPQLVNVSTQGLHTDSYSSTQAFQHSPNDSSFTEGTGLDDDFTLNYKRKRKSPKYTSKEYRVNSDGQTLEDGTKPTRLKDRRLTFDPVTCQITTSFPSKDKDVKLGHKPQPHLQEQPKQNPPVPPSLSQQTDWKELSRSDIIQSYLSQQSSVLTTSGTHAPSAYSFMSEFLRKEEQNSVNRKKTLTLAPQRPAQDLPGVNREVGDQDLSRLHAQQWSGVNGCYDTNGNWYDWTECISLDPHGDESRLNILPYVSLD